LTSSLELVEISDLHFSWQDRVVLDGISLSIPRGKVTVIMGPSGTGKTTLLQLIGGRLRPASGIVLVDGHSVPDVSRSALFELRKRMGMLFQNGALLTDLSVFENVAFPLREHSELPGPVIRQLVLMKLHLVGLRGARDMMPAQLSGGMARRVALARAIVMDPMMVMYDEPFTGLDPISRGVILKLIRSLNDNLGITSLVVTHDVNEALSIADNIFLLSNGHVVASGSPDELMASSSEEVSQFMQGKPEGPVHFHYPADDYIDDLFGVQP